MKSYIEQLENKHTRSMQKSILENDDHCKPMTISERIAFGIFCAFIVLVIVSFG